MPLSSDQICNSLNLANDARLSANELLCLGTQKKKKALKNTSDFSVNHFQGVLRIFIFYFQNKIRCQ